MSRGGAGVTVIGAGIFGLAAAWACVRRGARVRVIERCGIGAGASGGLVGALAPHVPERWDALKAFQFHALVMAEAWWAEVGAAAGTDPGYARIGRLQPLADAAAVARAEARAAGAAEHWGAPWSWRVRPVAEAAWPGLAVAAPGGHVIHDTLSARLTPRRASAALTAAIRARGGEVLEGVEPPEGLDAPVIWATGWEGLQAAGLGGGVKGQALLLAHDAAEAPLVMAPGLFVVPHGDGTVAVGSTSEESWTEAGSTDAQLDALRARAEALCPGLAGAGVVERWAGVRPRAADGRPLLGAWPGRPGHYLANGGFRIGFALAPAAAEGLADLVLEGRDSLPAAFRPPRG